MSSKTLLTILEWKKAIDASDGFILRALSGKSVAFSLGSGQVSRILKRLADNSQLPKSLARKISGHSLRVGAAQDWTNKGISLPQLMVLGGWEKSDTVMRYISGSRIQIEKINL